MLGNEGVLTRPDLQALLRSGDPDGLVITPMTDPRRQIGSNSIDLKLGCELLVPRHGRTAYLNLQQRADLIGASLSAAHERLRLRIGETFILHEHQFIMAETLEFVRLPANLAGYVMGRSSWERAGLHVRPARIPPGYTGCVQLQLVSHKDLPIQLITGARICQLLLFPVSTPLADTGRGKIVAEPSFSPILEDEELVALQGGHHHLVVGITGTLASGESALARYFHEEHGFHLLSLATPVYEEARRRQMDVTIENLQKVGNSLRRTYGNGVLVERLRAEIQRLPRDSHLVLMAIKHPGEVAALRQWPNFTLVGIDAPADLRYQWARAEGQFGINGQRAVFDRIDLRDRGVGQPSWGQQVAACIDMADYSIENAQPGETRRVFEECYAWVRKQTV